MHKPFEVCITVPIYDKKLYLNLSTSPIKQIKQHKVFKSCSEPGDDEEEESAFSCQTDYGEFGLFFSFLHLTKGVIAHEIFHATHHILEYIGNTFHEDHHEPYAYLNHWITDWVYEQIERKGIKVYSWSPNPALIKPTKKNGPRNTKQIPNSRRKKPKTRESRMAGRS